MHEKGLGGARDLSEARACFQRAADACGGTHGDSAVSQEAKARLLSLARVKVIPTPVLRK